MELEWWLQQQQQVVGVVVAAAAALLLLLLHAYGQRRSSRQQLRLPPGPRGLPVFGNLFLFAASKRWHADFYKLAQTYGPIMWLRLGSQGVVMVQSPELAAEVLRHQDTTFCSRPPLGYADALIMNDGKDVGMAPYGPHWRFMRKVMTVELLTNKRIGDFRHVPVEELGRMVEAIGGHMGQPVDLGFLLRTLNLNTVTRMALGKAAVGSYQVREPGPHDALSAEQDEAEAHELVNLVTEAVSILGVQGIGDAVPWLSFLDTFLLPKAKMERTHRQLHKFYSRVILEHRQYRADNPGLPPRDFVDVLLSASSSDAYGEAITDEVISAQLMDMFMAGIETTSSVVEWAMAELLRQPAAMAQAVQEVDRVVGGAGRSVTEADVANLPFLQAVVKETMRLHPPAPLLLPHYSTQAATLGGYHVPANTTVFVNVWGLGRDPAYWPHPELFQPTRFLQEQAQVDVRGHHFQLLPFGAGKRVCPGLTLGLALVHLSLATLLHAFSWTLPPDVPRPEDLDMTECQALVVHKASRLIAVPHLKPLYD